MGTLRMSVLGIFAAALVLSCAPSISRGGDYGTIQIGFGNSAARALATGWPGGTLPAFSTVTVKVSANDISPVTATASGYAGSLSVQAPAGNGRLVELIAVPAARSGAPDFAKSYYGSATVDLSEGQTTAVTIKLSLGETKLIMPKDGFGQEPGTTLIADSLSSGITGTIEDEARAFAFDNYGRLYIASSKSGNIQRYTSIAGAAEFVDGTDSPNSLAFDASKKRLYAMYNGDGWAFWYVDIGAAEPTGVDIQLPSGYEIAYDSNGMAVDDSGMLYVGLFNNAMETEGIGKLSIGAPSGGSVTASVVDFVSFSDLDLDSELGLYVRDIVATGGALYLAAANLETYDNYIDYLYSRGKVVAVETSTMTKAWETGWAGDTAHFPSAPNRNKQLHGPLGFVGIAPKKLYLADEGFYWDGTPNTNAEGISRVVEIDLDTRQITGVGLEDLYFVDDYSNLFIYGAYGQG